ncbi:MAG: TonB C-terminal domain-containing protein [Deltaproteobacteria bacterium]|nr:TonB C-terminal domain-containing protein [Deltaproteobacteria bacterium]
MLHGISKPDHGEGVNLNKMIFVSCLMHFIALTVLILAPSVPSPRWTFGPVYSVQLVSMSEALLNKGVRSSTLSREFMEMDRGRHSVVVKKNAEAVEPVPVKRIETHKQQDRESIINKALENLRKKSQEPPPLDVKRAVGAIAKDEAATPRNTKSGAADRAVDMYYAEIWSRIKSQWVFPQSISPKDDLHAIVDVKVLSSGTVTELRFEERSGNRYFDDSVLKAIRKASPFPPFPSEFGERSIELGIRFYASDLK